MYRTWIFLAVLAVSWTVLPRSGPQVALAGPPGGSRWVAGGDIGAWKPMKISTEGVLSPRRIPGTEPFLGVFAGVIVGRQARILASVGHWARTGFAPSSQVQRLDVLLASVGVASRLSDVSTLSPFVDYGVLAIHGREHFRSGETRAASGVGAYVGAGLTVQVVPGVGVFGRIRYLYAKFPRRVAGLEDYSGPFLSAGVMTEL
ncbi:MAG: hypothetical protein GXO73_12070 [Calditrichaeota bacterium]|nr:hypothetical protein [Calditrichota bacterium]